jgi:hypothetical protein
LMAKLRQMRTHLSFVCLCLGIAFWPKTQPFFCSISKRKISSYSGDQELKLDHAFAWSCPCLSLENLDIFARIGSGHPACTIRHWEFGTPSIHWEATVNCIIHYHLIDRKILYCKYRKTAVKFTYFWYYHGLNLLENFFKLIKRKLT